jgi:hypothetical protein
VSAALATGWWTLLETALVLAIVAAWARQAVRTLWPAAWRRARVATALSLLRADRPAWLRPLGRALAPTPAHAGIAGSCGPCRGCEKGTAT